jgi:hypothetical protein
LFLHPVSLLKSAETVGNVVGIAWWSNKKECNSFDLSNLPITIAVTILIELGPWYRITMYTAALVSMMVTRFILFGIYLKVMPAKRLRHVMKERSL